MKKGKHLREQKISINKIIQNIVFTVCVVVFIFSSYKVIRYIIEAKVNKDMNNELIEKAITFIENNENNEENENNESNEQEKLQFNVDFSVLKQENEDIVGWIYSENTPINYPILQSEDNQYYLRRLMNGKYNISGSIFMDYRNDPKLSDNNTIIYGHNMKNNAMFGTLTKYRNQEYYENHKIMYLFTPEKNYTIKLFTGFTESVNSNIYNLTTINQTKIDELINKSDFKTDTTVTKENKIITLSTCAYEYDGARYIVMGVLEDI